MKLFLLIVTVLAIHFAAAQSDKQERRLRYCENCVNCPGCRDYNESDQDGHSIENENTEIENKGSIFVMFYTANWCGACRGIKPVLSYLLDAYPNAHLNTINVDEDPEMAMAHNIRRLPTFLFHLNGKELARIDNGNVNSLIKAFDRYF